jgi:FkbM family methyltransferase
LNNHLNLSEQEALYHQNNNRWFADHGDKTLRLDYDLNENSIVFDLGGYEGQWASDIFSKFCCNVHVFEPIKSFASQIEHRFSKNSKIKVHNFGLAPTTTKAQISLAENCSSIIKNSPNCEEIQLFNAFDFISQGLITKIDLMKVNIEGSEYDLLEHLIKTNLISQISNIQVQFHNFFPEAEERMETIQSKLTKTHSLTWQYRFVWENWRLKI